MKIIFVQNPEDVASTQTLQASKDAIAASAMAPGIELYTVDFMELRNIVPITACPSVFVGLDEIVGDPAMGTMTMEDLLAGIQAAEQVIQDRIAARAQAPTSG